MYCFLWTNLGANHYIYVFSKQVEQEICAKQKNLINIILHI